MPLKVFYLDDEPELCEIFKDEFESADCTVVTFVSAEKILEATKCSPPDLIFLDYRLTETNGDLVAQAMPLSIPKYLITGESSVRTQYKFLGVLGKPFDREAIREIMDRVLSSKKAA